MNESDDDTVFDETKSDEAIERFIAELSETTGFVNVFQFIALRVKALVDASDSGLKAWKKFSKTEAPDAQALFEYLSALDGSKSGKIDPGSLENDLADLGDRMNDQVINYFIANQANGTNNSLGSSIIMQAMGYELIRMHKMAFRVYNPVIWDRCFQVKMIAISDVEVKRRAFVAGELTWQLYVIDKVAQKPIPSSLYTSNVKAMIKKLGRNVSDMNAQTTDGSTVKSDRGTVTDTSVSVWSQISAGTYFDSNNMSIF